MQDEDEEHRQDTKQLEVGGARGAGGACTHEKKQS